MWGIGNNKTISTTNIFFHCEHKSMTKILVIRQIFGQRLPKNWSSFAKKLVIIRRQHWSSFAGNIGPTQRLPKNWSSFTKILVIDSPKNWSSFAKKLVIIRQKIGLSFAGNIGLSFAKKLARLRDYQKIGQRYQKIGLSFAGNIGQRLPKFWSEITKKLVRDYQKIGLCQKFGHSLEYRS